MKPAIRKLALGLFLSSLVPLSAAEAQVSVSPISDVIVTSGDTLDVSVVAVDPSGGSIALTATLPAFAVLNEPTSATGSVVSTITITPLDGDLGTHNGSVTATSGDLSDTEPFQITVTAADSDQPPRVIAPEAASVAEGSPLLFDVLASDADGDAITSLTAIDAPEGATFTPNSSFTSGTFSWTPGGTQAGEYDVIFAASNALPDSATTHITVIPANLTPVSLAPIDDVTLAEGATATIDVTATDPDAGTIDLSASLPGFATLNDPTESVGSASLATTITIAPGDGTAGSYDASVTATSDGDTATESFTIEVTAPALAASASMIGSYNEHKKFICFKVAPVDGDFDLLLVSLPSITLSYGGNSISTVRPTHLAFDCDAECDSCGDDESGEDDTTDVDETSSDCLPSHVMACFSMDDIRSLFGDATLPLSFADATIEGTLTGGEPFSATIGGAHITSQGKGLGGVGSLALRVHPNPMNPSAAISFTLERAGRVRVAIYDLSGRLVKMVREREFAPGSYTVAWDGTGRSGGRVASGVYFVSVQAGTARDVRRVTVLK